MKKLKESPVREIANKVVETATIFSLKQPDFGKKQVKSLKGLSPGQMYQIVIDGNPDSDPFILLWPPKQTSNWELYLEGLKYNKFTKRYIPAIHFCAGVGIVPFKNGMWIKRGALLRTGRKISKGKLAKLRKLKF